MRLYPVNAVLRGKIGVVASKNQEERKIFPEIFGDFFVEIGNKE